MTVLANETQRLMRFDWALKWLLRNKSNFVVLEGFLSALLKRDVKILDILESESNQESNKSKLNRVDLLVKDKDGEIIIVEIQNEHESDYLERLLFGTCKVIVDNFKLGEKYNKISKVISVSIQYFNLGQGEDYVYYGTTDFIGIHSKEKLTIKKRIKTNIGIELKDKPNVFPEYYLINVNRFKGVVKEDIDEWIYFLKNEKIEKEFKSKNIQIAAEKLNIMKMTENERKSYEKYLMEMAREIDIIDTAKLNGEATGLKKGEEIGLKKGEEIGIKKGLYEAAKNLMDILDDETISLSLGISIEEIKNLRSKR